MAYIFGDSFDLYAALADIYAGYWDAGTTTGISLATGRFAGSQGLQTASANAGGFLIKVSGVNDSVHHILCAVRCNAPLTGTAANVFFGLLDGAGVSQCTVVFRSDGAILLTSGGAAGTTLATYTGAVSAQNTWFAFEIEVVVHNTAGSISVRKNGNTSNDFTLGSLNTRGGSANNYANRLVVGTQTLPTAPWIIDDLLWRSDAASVPWMGDIRCYTRLPASDASAQFARAPSPALVTIASSTTGSDPTATSHYTAFTASFSGAIATIVAGFNPGFTGNCKMSLFSDNAGVPGAVLGSATTLVNPVTGNNTFTLGTPVSVVKGTQYWFGVSHDVTAVLVVGATNSSGRTSTVVSYASFPTANPAVGTNVSVIGSTITITPSLNAEYVNETLQDGATSYVYDSTVGHADFYNIAPLSVTPATVIAVVTRGFMEKSDAGFRSGNVQLKSGGSTVSPTTLNLATGWLWSWRVDLTDPNTSAAWTPAAVNNVQIGPIVTG